MDLLDPPPNPSDNNVVVFAHAAQEACVFELRCRLLADKHPALVDISLDDLSPLVDAIVDAFPELDDAQKKLLTTAVKVRNKLLHQELSRATGQLKTLGESIKSGGVVELNLSTGATTQVSGTRSQPGRLYGWLFEATMSGGLLYAHRAFKQANQIVLNLMLIDRPQT